MAKLEELKAAAEAADDAWGAADAFDAWVYAVDAERGWDATTVRDYAAKAAWEVAARAARDARDTYKAELKKQEENSNDH
jgi:hypothetical protein